MCTVEENWNYEIDITAVEEKNFSIFKSQIFKFCDDVLKMIDNSFILGYYNNQDGEANSSDDDLKNILESNKNLRQEIDQKVKNLQDQQVRYRSFKHDQKLLSEEIKEKHEAFLLAKKFYKKYLKIYISNECKTHNTQTVYVQFFTEAKKESDNYSVRLIKNLDSGKYELLRINPELKNFQEVQRKLQEINDPSGALCCIRDYFLNEKSSNKIINKKK